MAGEIKQVIGFDTSGAITAIDALDKRLNVFGSTLDTTAGKLNNFGVAADKAFSFDASKGTAGLNKIATAADVAQKKVGSAFGVLATDAQKAGAAIQKGLGPQAVSNVAKTGEAAKKTANDVDKATKTLTVSFKTLARIVTTQVIIRAFSQISQAIRASIQDNIDFSRSVREIGTILPEAQRNADGLAASVRGISDAFNLPLGEVSEGLYQTISNQIGNASESVKFLATAAVFARVSVSSLNDSVNLLTAVVNAYQLEASDADGISAQLFKTIELGRTRASELANSLGRILPVMRELGVTTSETFAAISTLTIQGQKTSEALTQIRGAANALLKPTTATSDALAELGFSSAEALVAARGLAGAFQALRGQTDGTLEGFAKIVPRVRGMNAALALSGSGARKFETDLRKIEKAAEETLKTPLEFVISSNAETVSAELNRLKNVFTADLGAAINDTLAVVLKFTGGVGTMAVVFKTLIPIFAIVATSLALYATLAAAAAIKTQFLAVTAAEAGVTIGAAFVVATAGIALLAGAFLFAKAKADEYAAGIERAAAGLQEAHDNEIKSAERAASATRQLNDARLRRLNAQAQEQIAAFNLVHKKRVDLAKRANDQIVADQDRVVANVISASEKVLQATVSRVKKQRQLQANATANAVDLQADLADVQFKNDNKRLDGLQRYANLDRRANSLASQGRALLANATTEADAASARAILDRADGFAQESASLAEQLGHRDAISQSERLSESLLRSRIQGEQTLARAADAAAQKDAVRATAQREALKNLKSLATAVSEAPSLFDSEGEALRGKELEDALATRERALKAFRTAVLGSQDISVSDLIDVSKLSLDVGKELSEAKITGLTVDSGAIDNLKTFIGLQFLDFQIEFGAIIESLELAQGIKIGNISALVQALNRQVPQSRELAAQNDEILKTQLASNQAVHRAQVEATLLNTIAGEWETPFGPAAQTNANKFITAYVKARPVVEALNDALKRGEPIQLSEIPQSLVDFQENADAPKFTAISSEYRAVAASVDRLVESLQAASDATDQLQVLREGGGAQTAAGSVELQSQRDLDNRVILERQLGEAATKAQKAAEAQAGITDQASNTAEAVGGINQQLAVTVQATAQIVENLRQASNISFNAPSTTAATTAATGGLAHFAKGGGPRGTDTIPAWLSPGEYVMNARSTRKFYSQLQAMNSGTQPVYRQEGGPVTNVGDINVHVASGQKGDAAGRTIARSIRRELRRNTSQL